MGITYGVGVPDRSVAQFGTLAEAKKYCIGYYQSNIRDAQGEIKGIKALTKKKLVEDYFEELKNPPEEDDEDYEEE